MPWLDIGNRKSDSSGLGERGVVYLRDAYLNIVEKDYMGSGMRIHGSLSCQGMYKLRKLRKN